MTRAPVQNLSRKPASVLVVQRPGGGGTSLRYLIAGLSAGAVRVTDSGTLSTADAKALDALKQKSGGADLVQLLPPECVVVRPVGSGGAAIKLDGPPDQVAGSLALLAEGEMPSTVPAHRRCAGVLRVGQGHAVYAMAWVADADTLPGATLVPAPAALAALHRLTGAGSGLAAYCAEASGSVLIAGCSAGEPPRVVARVLRDDPTDDVAWQQVVAESLADAAADLAVEQPIPASPTLRLPRMPVSTFGLSAADPKAALSEFGLLLGAASLALRGKPDEQPLLMMTQRSASVRAPIWQRVVDGLASPRRAGVAAAVCVLVLIAGWIVAAPLHLSVLKAKAGADTTDYAKAAEQSEWYRTLRERRWPMTAIVAELTAQAPQGITIESLTMEQNRPITLGGTAPSALALNAWRTALRSNRVFDEVQWNSPDEAAVPVRFTISAKVAEPLLAGGAELKAIAATPADPTRPASNGDTRRPATPANGGRTINTRNTNPTPNRASRDNNSSTPAAPPAARSEVPPPLSDAQINALDKIKVTLEWAKRKGRLEDVSLDEGTRSRLRAEWEKLDQRRQQLQKEGS